MDIQCAQRRVLWTVLMYRSADVYQQGELLVIEGVEQRIQTILEKRTINLEVSNRAH